MKKSATTKNKKTFSDICREEYEERSKKNDKYKREVLEERFNLRIKKRRNLPFNEYKIASFDIETTTYRNDFYLFGYINTNGEYLHTFDKLEAVRLLRKDDSTYTFKYATNLGFDFNGIVEGTNLRSIAEIIMRGNQYISVNFQGYENKVKLLDTSNYGGLSVESMGKILRMPKLKKPKCLGKHPKNNKEKAELIEYNKRDCEVSRGFMLLVQKVVNSLGGELKLTISSCAMDIFRRSFLEWDVFQEKHFINHTDLKSKIFRAYYGGRTEAFKRGYISGEWYYGDVNSLYPSVMLNEYPVLMSVNYIENPNKEDYKVYLSYEGVSVFTINVPYTRYPLLPYRKDNKLIFPYGLLENVSLTHLEVRRQIELFPETEILEMKETIYYTETKPYFKKYVETLYALRQKYKAEGSEMEVVIKLLLNSLYGKFAMKNVNKTEFFNFDDYDEALKKVLECEEKGIKIHLNSANEAYYNEDEEYDGITSYPIWSVYVTAYARIKIHEYITKYNAVYCDTDSVITEMRVKDSKVLGELKLEKKIREAYIIKAKLYFSDDEIKCKGVPIPKTQREKMRLKRKILNGKPVSYRKFIKVKEGINRDIKVNSIITQIKKIDLEDDKRVWTKKFNSRELQDSEPIRINGEK